MKEGIDVENKFKGIIIVEIFLIVLGIVLSIIVKDFLFVTVSSTVSLSSILLLYMLKSEFDIMGKKALNEERKISKIYNQIAKYYSESELEVVEQSFELHNNKLKNKVIIISNDLSKEFGEWGDIVIQNIKHNVCYTYFTTYANLQYIETIKKGLIAAKIDNIEERINIFWNDSYFEFLPQYSEIVVYNNIGQYLQGSKATNKRACFVCYCSDRNPTEDNLYYEKVSDNFCNDILKKIGKHSKEIKSENCNNECNHNSLWEKYVFHHS